MSKYFDQVATVSIDLSTPVSDEANFDNVVLVGALPASPNLDGNNDPVYPAEFAGYSSLDEVIEAGWKVSGESPDPVGLAAQTAFAQNPRPSKIYIAPVPEGSGKTIEDAVDIAVTYPGWYVCCPAVMVGDTTNIAKYADIAAKIEGYDKMFCYTDLAFFTGGTPAVSTTLMRTMFVTGRRTSAEADADLPKYNNFANVAMTVKWLSYDSGSETAAFKQVSLIEPSTFSTAEMNQVAAAHGNYIISMGGKVVTMNGQVVGNEWADVIRFRDWLKNDMQVRVVNLFISNPKIPFTDSGISQVQNLMIASLTDGQARGGIAEDEFDADGNVNRGFTTSVPLSSDITSVQKQSRILRNCKFDARLAGAIHEAHLKGTLTYEAL